MKKSIFLALAFVLMFALTACAQSKTSVIKIDDLSLQMLTKDVNKLKKYDYVVPIEMSIDVDDYEECVLYSDECGRCIVTADNRNILFDKDGVICDNLKQIPDRFKKNTTAYYAFAFAFEMCDCYLFVGIDKPKKHQK